MTRRRDGLTSGRSISTVTSCLSNPPPHNTSIDACDQSESAAQHTRRKNRTTSALHLYYSYILYTHSVGVTLRFFYSCNNSSRSTNLTTVGYCTIYCTVQYYKGTVVVHLFSRVRWNNKDGYHHKTNPTNFSIHYHYYYNPFVTVVDTTLRTDWTPQYRQQQQQS
jgi:hypothetical protein